MSPPVPILLRGELQSSIWAKFRHPWCRLNFGLPRISTLRLCDLHPFQLAVRHLLGHWVENPAWRLSDKPLAVVSAVTHFTGPGVERRMARREPGLHELLERFQFPVHFRSLQVGNLFLKSSNCF